MMPKDNSRKNSAKNKKNLRLARQVDVKRTPQEQLAHLDSLLGKGVGAVRERRNLMEKIQLDMNIRQANAYEREQKLLKQS